MSQKTIKSIKILCEYAHVQYVFVWYKVFLHSIEQLIGIAMTNCLSSILMFVQRGMTIPHPHPPSERNKKNKMESGIPANTQIYNRKFGPTVS